MKHTYYIKGMSCQGCRSHVEKSLASVPGVSNVSVDLEKANAQIESPEHINIEAFQTQLDKDGGGYSIHDRPSTGILSPGESSGYYCPMQCEGTKVYPEPGACPVCGMDLVPIITGESEDNDQLRTLTKKFWIALVLTIPIFVLAMGEMIPGNPLLSWLPPKYSNWLQLALSIPVVFYCADFIFERAFRSIKTRNLNMFTLIGLGAMVAWLFSIVAVIWPDVFPDQFRTENGEVHVYFEATTVILTLVLLGQLLEARAHEKTSSAVRELLELSPNTAIRLEDGTEREVDISLIAIGDILRVKPGDKIPVDGRITKGTAYVDESMISGEPIPVSKMRNDMVIGGTINGNSSFLMKASRVGADTLLSQIIGMVNEASRSKAPIQNLADLIARYFVPIVVLIALVTFIIWSVWGPTPAYVYALVNAIAVLIIACPCALGLATPMSVMVGVGKGAKNGILFRNATSLQNMSKITTLVVDKTGTLTEGKPSLESVVLHSNQLDKEEFIRYAASISRLSEHPLAKAIDLHARQQGIELLDVNKFKTITGRGARGIVDKKDLLIGNKELMDSLALSIDDQLEQKAQKFQDEGKTVSFLALDKIVLGFLVISDPIKNTSKEALASLKKRGIEVIMLTGDNIRTARYVASVLDLKSFEAGLLPEDKLKIIQNLQNEGQLVAMAGDGINDAPALAQSQVGIAMGTGTDVAMESADITLVHGDLKNIVRAYDLSTAVLKNIRQNLFFAMIYNTLGVPVAAGILFPFFGILLSPMIAAAAMSFSSVSVIFNSLRLRSLNLE